jgi:hypothetical protein
MRSLLRNNDSNVLARDPSQCSTLRRGFPDDREGHLVLADLLVGGGSFGEPLRFVAALDASWVAIVSIAEQEDRFAICGLRIEPRVLNQPRARGLQARQLRAVQLGALLKAATREAIAMAEGEHDLLHPDVTQLIVSGSALTLGSEPKPARNRVDRRPARGWAMLARQYTDLLRTQPRSATAQLASDLGLSRKQVRDLIRRCSEKGYLDGIGRSARLTPIAYLTLDGRYPPTGEVGDR